MRTADDLSDAAVPALTPVDLVGVGARLPESNSPTEFYQNLLSGKDLITESDHKWRPEDYPDLPGRFGKLKNGELEAFDASFFQIHGRLAQVMDPQLKKLLEVSWEAWIDSGLDVWALRHSRRVGVYCGSCGSEVQGAHLAEYSKVSGYEALGCVQSMFANRISYTFSFRGPSKQMDTACSSSAIALHDALADISAGRTDYALVVGANSILYANMMQGFFKLGMLSPDGKCKSFDAAGNGYARAEGISAIVLQRSGMKDAPRWAAISPYATFINAGTNNDGYTKEGITFPNTQVQLALEKQVCKGAKINPAEIVYVEMHGTGTVAGDGQELAAVNNWYGKAAGRTAPVWIGSVKSNMGHCEGNSVLASLTKLCLSIENGCLPGNLWYHRDTPNPTSEGLRDGTLKVVDENTPWDGGLFAVSSFGFGGSNVHTVLRGTGKERSQSLYSKPSPKNTGLLNGRREERDSADILPLAARSSEGLQAVAKLILEAGLGSAGLMDPLRRFANSAAEDLRLCHRGTIMNGELKNGTTKSVAPQVWFAFSGNGSQWPTMALSLLENNTTFRETVMECAKIVEPLGIDLLEEFRNDSGWANSSLGALGLVSIQLGLVDVLQEEYGIVPDGMLGHSAGEIACTYASRTCSRKQAMLIAYHRGRLPGTRGIAGGLMAATGLSAAEATQRLEGSSVVMACDNSPVSTTISGPAKAVKAVLAELDEQNIFGRELTTNGIAWHSSCLDPVLSELMEELRTVIPNPKERPSNWISACFPPNDTSAAAQHSSAEYQVHSYRNPVLFTDAAAQIPENAVIVEIGPHSILRSPLRQNRPELKYVGVMRKGACGVETLNSAVAEMWRSGVPVHWEASPVPQGGSGTEVPRAIRDALVSWERQDYALPNIMNCLGGGGKLYEKTFNLGAEHEYLCDHNVDGSVLLPMSSFMVAAWECLAKTVSKSMWECPVEFLDVLVLAPVRVNRGDTVALGVSLDQGHRFQVVNGDEVVMEGRINFYSTDSIAREPKVLPDRYKKPRPDKAMLGIDPELVTETDRANFYMDSNRHGIFYGPRFQPVEGYGTDRTFARLRWEGDWISYLDGVFQVANRENDYELHVATGVRRLAILDTRKDSDLNEIERLEVDPLWNICRSPSVLMEAFGHEIAPRKPAAARVSVGSMRFVPYGDFAMENPARESYSQQLTGFVKSLARERSAIQHQATDEANELAALVGKLPLDEAIDVDGATAVDVETSELARLLSRVMASGAEKQEIDDAEFRAAVDNDLFARGLGKAALQLQLLLLSSNQRASGYNVCEIGAGSGQFTREALSMMIELPHTPLVKYTATDTEDGQAAFAENLAHKKLDYKVWDINSATASATGTYDAIIANNLSQKALDLPATLQLLHQSLSEGGFLLLSELTCALGGIIFGSQTQFSACNTDQREFGTCTSIAHWRRLLCEAGFTEISVARCPTNVSASFLFRKLCKRPKKAVSVAAPLLGADSATMDSWIQQFVGTLESATAAEALEESAVWVHGTMLESPGVQGFVNSARKEPKGDNIRGVLNWDTDCSLAELIERSSRLDMANNCFKQGIHGAYISLDAAYQMTKSESETAYGCHLAFATLGNLKSNFWRENPIPQPALVMCRVTYGALNFRDVMLASGKLSRQQMSHKNGGDFIGTEFSGYVESNGRRVMGFGKNAIATRVAVPPNVIFEVPESWSQAEAAGVPTAYLTSYYSLVMRGQLRKGMRVLIHSGTGAVGLAAIQICLSRGAEVFTTCGSAVKKQFLLDTFPDLKEGNIGDSRSTSFEGLICNATAGQGVDLVLNSLSDDKLQASVRCLGKGGKLLEIGKYDILKGTNLSMKPLLQNINFQGIDLDRVATGTDTRELDELRIIMENGIASGEVRPLPVKIFPRTQAEEAFRYLGQGVHIGKCMIEMEPPPFRGVANCMGPKSESTDLKRQWKPQDPAGLAVHPQFFCRQDRSYVITGGVGGFGLALADWLAAKGAKHILLTSKRGVRTGSQALHLQDMFDKGCRFLVSKLDASDPAEAKEILLCAEKMAPIGGIFHLAMTLKDKLLPNQTGESWNACIAPKAIGAYNLDKASRGISTIEHFVMWSSIVSYSGNEGQCNYGFANACLDMLAEQRKKEGLPAFSIQFGVVDNVGVADKRMQELMAAGLLEATLPQPIDDCLKILGRMLCGGKGYGAVMSSHWVPPDLLGSASETEGKGLLESVLGVLGLQAGGVTDTDTLPSLGMDSMQLVEVRAHLQRCLGRPVPLEEIGGLTIGKIKALEGDSSAPAAPKQTQQTPPPKGRVGEEPVKPASSGKGHQRTESAASSASPPNTPSKGDSRTLRDMDSPSSGSPAISRPGSPHKEHTMQTSDAASHPAAPQLGKPNDATGDKLWAVMSLCGVFILSVLIAAIPALGFKAAIWIARIHGLTLAALSIPLLWIASGFATIVCVAIANLFVMPQFREGEQVKMWTLPFARWWFMCRLNDYASRLFLCHFRGSAVITWFYRLMGASIGQDVAIDSLDIMDLQFVVLGDKAVIGQHTSLHCHTFSNGHITFSRVVIPGGTVVYPGAVITPELAQTVVSFARDNPVSKMVLAKDPGGLETAAANKIAGSEQAADVILIKQVAGVALIGFIVTLSAFAGTYALAALLHFCLEEGQAGHLGPSMYALTALIALNSPALAGYLPVILQMGAFTAGSLLGYVPMSALALAMLPLAVAVYAVALVGLTAALKWFLIGRIEPAIHRRNTAYGLSFWLSGALVEVCNSHVGNIIVGTWLYSALYSIFGARFKQQSTNLSGLTVTEPDMLVIDSHVHIGDMAYLITRIALDSRTILTAPIHLKDQTLLGTGSIVMPGTTLGEGSSLVPLSVTKPGANLAADFMCRGHPAIPLMKARSRSAATHLQNHLSATGKLMYIAVPFLTWTTVIQVIGVTGLASAAASQIALATLPGIIGAIIAMAVAMAVAAALPLAFCKAILAATASVGTDGDSFGRYSPKYFANIWRSISCLSIMTSSGSLWANSGLYTALYAWVTGHKIGKGVYLDAARAGDPGLLTYRDGAIVDRASLLLSHTGTYEQASGMSIAFRRIDLGDGAVVGSRAIVMPGCAIPVNAIIQAGIMEMSAGLAT